MTGKHILNLMNQEGYSINKMAQLIGTSQPNLSSALKHDDVRTGLLEDIAKAMGKPLSFFYGETYTISGGNNATGNNSHNTVNASDDKLLTLLMTKDEQLTLAMKQTSKAQEQTSKAQSQMDRVLDKWLSCQGEVSGEI